VFIVGLGDTCLLDALDKAFVILVIEIDASVSSTTFVDSRFGFLAIFVGFKVISEIHHIMTSKPDKAPSEGRLVFSNLKELID